MSSNDFEEDESGDDENFTNIDKELIDSIIIGRI